MVVIKIKGKFKIFLLRMPYTWQGKRTRMKECKPIDEQGIWRKNLKDLDGWTVNLE